MDERPTAAPHAPAPQVLLVDGHNVAHMVSHDKRYKGRPGGVIEGFLQRLRQFLDALPVVRCVVAWDTGRDPRRVRRYADYKIQRRERRAQASQEDRIRLKLMHEDVGALRLHVLQGLGVDQVVGAGPAEADDLIWLMVQRLRDVGKYGSVIILSSDGDLHQLLTPAYEGHQPSLHVLQVSPSAAIISKSEWQAGVRLRHRLRDGRWLREEKGWWPEAHVLMRALIGDASDSLPGVKGVGEKTAVQLLEHAGGNVRRFFEQYGRFAEVTARARALDTPEGLAIVQRNMAMMRLCAPEQPPMQIAAPAVPGLAGEAMRRAVADRLAEEYGVRPWSGVGWQQERGWWLAPFKALMDRWAAFNRQGALCA